MVFSMNLPPLPRAPVEIKIAPIDQAHLIEIQHRMMAGMNPEGAAILYPQDTSALLGEVFYLREQITLALLSLRLLPVSHSLDLAATAEAVAERWEELVQGTWQKTQMRALRERATEAEEKLRVEREAIAERSRAIDAQTAAFVLAEEQRVAERKEIGRLQARVTELEQERRQLSEDQSKLNALRDLLER